MSSAGYGCMSAEEIIALIAGMKPKEIEKLFVLVREYEIEVRRRQAGTRYATPQDVKLAANKMFTKNARLFRLAKLEKGERQKRLRSAASS